MNIGKGMALLASVVALCMALAGCGGSSEQESKAAFSGTWDLSEMSQGSEVTGSDELQALKSRGLEAYVNLNVDGASALVLFGEVTNGTWRASSTTAGTIRMEGQDVSMSISDSKLTFEQDGAKLTFTKGEPKATPANQETAGSAERMVKNESSSVSSSSTREGGGFVRF